MLMDEEINPRLVWSVWSGDDGNWVALNFHSRPSLSECSIDKLHIRLNLSTFIPSEGWS